MSWQISLLLYFVAIVVLTIFQRVYSQKTTLPESVPPAMAYLLGITPLGIIVGLLLPHHIHWSSWVIMLLVVEGLCIGSYNKLSFKAMSLLPVAQYQTVYQSYEIVVIALGWMLLGEGLTFFQIVGALLLLVAAILAIWAPFQARKKTKLKNSANLKAVYLTLSSSLIFGVGLVAEKATLHYMDIGTYFMVGFMTQTTTIVGLALFQMKRQNIRALPKTEITRSFLMGVILFSVGSTYINALVKSNNVSLITALAAFSLPLTVFASYLYLHERENVKLLWSAMALACVGLVVAALH